MRAVSPLITTVILIAISLTLLTLVASWTISFTKSSATIVKEQRETEIKCSNAGLVVDNLRYNCTAGMIYLEAYNSGYQKLENFKFTIILTNDSTYNLIANNISLSTGETAAFYNYTVNQTIGPITPSSISKLYFLSQTCPLTTKNERDSSRITADNC